MPFEPLSRFEWERVVMQVVMPPTTKLVALALATYGDRNGAKIHPGNKRLSLELCISPRTVERHIDWLRTNGLLEQTFQGRSAGRKGMANTYRLGVATDLAERVAFVGTADTGDGSSPVDIEVTPDTDDGSSEQNTRHGGQEHPTPVTGTPDTSDGTPVTRDDPSWNNHQTIDQVGNSSSDGEAAYLADLEVLKALPVDEQTRLLAEVDETLQGADWPALVHGAARLVNGAVA